MPQRCLQTSARQRAVRCHGTKRDRETWCSPLCRGWERTYQDGNPATCSRCQGCHDIVWLWVLTSLSWRRPFIPMCDSVAGQTSQCFLSVVPWFAQMRRRLQACHKWFSAMSFFSFFLTAEQQHVAPGMDDLRAAPIRVILFVTLKLRKHTHTRTKHFLNHNSGGPPAETRSGGDTPAF